MCKAAHCQAFLLKGGKAQGKMGLYGAGHWSKAKTGTMVLWLAVDTSRVGAIRFKCGILKNSKNKSPDHHPERSRGDHHRLIPQLLTYRERGQALAGVPCDIGLVVSVYAPENICLGAKPTCMWLAGCAPGQGRGAGEVDPFSLRKYLHANALTTAAPWRKRGDCASALGCFQTSQPTSGGRTGAATAPAPSPG